MIAHAGGDAPAQELDAAQFEAHLQQRLEEQQHQVMDGGREVGWLGCTTRGAMQPGYCGMVLPQGRRACFR